MGGVACAKAAQDAGLAGLVVLSSPTIMGDPLTLTADDFAGLAIPKLFVAAQGDPYATNVQQRYAMAQEPKQRKIVDGSAHGVDLYDVFVSYCRVTRRKIARHGVAKANNGMPYARIYSNQYTYNAEKKMLL